MRWYAKLGSIAGIEIRVHATFLLLLAWVGLATAQQTDSIAAGLDGVLIVIALFVCVVLHELGHALTARRFGIRTRDITLLPIGGIARLERMPAHATQELAVAVAGPLVSLALAVVFGLLAAATSGLPGVQEPVLTAGSFVERLAVLNLLIAGFNLLPAFPMDGGRVLRSLLALRLPYERATRIAAAFGKSLAVVFGVLGFMANPFLVLIALFVWIGATHEAAAAEARSLLAGVSVGDATIREFRSLAAEEPLSAAAEHALRSWQRAFPIVAQGQCIGLLAEDDIAAAIARLGFEAGVARALRRDCDPVDPQDPLENALTRMQSTGCRALPVVQSGRLIGVVTLDGISDLLSVRSARRRGRPGLQDGVPPVGDPARPFAGVASLEPRETHG